VQIEFFSFPFSYYNGILGGGRGGREVGGCSKLGVVECNGRGGRFVFYRLADDPLRSRSELPSVSSE